MRHHSLNSTLTAVAGAGLILAATTTSSLAHNTSVEFDDHTHYTDRYNTARTDRDNHVTRYGSYRPGYVHFSDAAKRLEESSDRFRDRVRELRRDRNGRRARALTDESSRFENLADTLRDIARDGRRHRGDRAYLIRDLRESGSRIDYLVSAYSQRPRLQRSWRRTRTHLGGVFETLRVGSARDYAYDNNRYAPFFPNRFDGGYNEGGSWNYDHSRNHGDRGKKHDRRGHKPAARTHPKRGVVWASDQVEDASERTKNAYRHHIKSARIANHGWARQLNGEFSAFDQAANRLRSSVQSNGRAPRAIYNELQNRRARIDSLMQGRPVGPTTRQHWTTVVNALGSLGNTY